MRHSRQGDQDRLRDYRLDIVRETEMAVGVINVRGALVWLPKSEIRISELTAPPTISVPEWLADQRELGEDGGP